MVCTLFFDQISENHQPLIGGKALHLASMTRWGLQVPPFFCITTWAYRQFIETYGLAPYIEAQLASLDYKNPLQLRAVATRIQERILANQIPSSLQSDILRAHTQLLALHSGKLAVRSSALAEDTPDASFAGQHDTFLGITGAPALLEAIRQCWASLWTPRVIQYRERAGYSHHDAALAVVVQEAIAADVAGVMFTANPVTSNREEMVINATWGLGESLVSGLVDADQITVARTTGAIQEYRLGQKQKRINMVQAGSGTVESDTGALSGQKSLTEAQIAQLVNLAKLVETKAEAPQDLEWCIRENRIYLLQTRPITTLAKKNATVARDLDEQHWTADNAQEAFPTVVSPVTMSFIKDLLTDEFIVISRQVGVDVSGLEFSEFFDGYVYLNATALAKMLGSLLPAADEEVLLKQLLGGGQEGGLKFRPQSVRQLKRLLYMAFYTTRDLIALPRQARRAVKKILADQRRLADIAWDRLSIAEIFSIYHQLIETVHEAFRAHVQGTMAYAFFYGWLTEFLRKLPPEMEIYPSIFVAGLGTLEDGKMKHGLWQVIQAVRNHPVVMQAVQQQEPGRIWESLQNMAGAEPVCRAFAEFLDRFGHMGDNLGDVITPRWKEDPASLWKLIKAGLAVSGITPQEHDAKMVRRRRATIAKVNDYLSRGIRGLFPVRKWQFMLLRKLAAFYAPYRENTKFHMLKNLLIHRRLLLHLGTILQQRQYLQAPEDIFFLGDPEMRQAIAGTLSPNLTRDWVVQRRVQHKKWEKMVPPRNIYTVGGKIVRKVYDDQRVVGNELRGVAASSGCVRGKTRIIMDLSQAEKLQAGDILVTRFTDPAWTPLFSLVSGIVMDIGSVLSHGAVVARELGVPAVVGVRCGTEVLQDGQEIVVDGNQGVVKWR